MLKAIEEPSLYTIKTITYIDDLFQRTKDFINQKMFNIQKKTVEIIFE